MGSPPLERRLCDAVATWEGVTVQPHRYAGWEFRVHQRKFAHVRAGHAVDLPLPMRLRRDLVAAGRAQPHPTIPTGGWISHPLRTEHDLPAVLALLRLNYDRLRGVMRPLPRPLSAPTAVAAQLTLLGDRAADDLPA